MEIQKLTSESKENNKSPVGCCAYCGRITEFKYNKWDNYLYCTICNNIGLINL